MGFRLSQLCGSGGFKLYRLGFRVFILPIDSQSTKMCGVVQSHRLNQPGCCLKKLSVVVAFVVTLISTSCRPVSSNAFAFPESSIQQPVREMLLYKSPEHWNVKNTSVNL